MGILTLVLLVFFIIVAILLILMVLVQNEEGDGLGGLFGGGAGSAFGSRSGNVLTRGTSVLGALFLVLSLGLALLSRTPSATGVEEAGREQVIQEIDPEGIPLWMEDDSLDNDFGSIDLDGFDFESFLFNSEEASE